VAQNFSQCKFAITKYLFLWSYLHIYGSSHQTSWNFF
jgi:hypothetical protein